MAEADEHLPKLEKGIAAGFGVDEGAAGESVLRTIERLHGARSDIYLREAEEGATPVLRQRRLAVAGGRALPRPSFQRAMALGYARANTGGFLVRCLLRTGRFADAHAVKEQDWNREIPALCAKYEPQLARIVSGELKPKDAKQAWGFGMLCRWKGEHAAATRLFRDADREVSKEAACSAVLSGDPRREGARASRPVVGGAQGRSHLASVRDRDDVPPAWRAFWADLDRRIAEKCKLVR